MTCIDIDRDWRLQWKLFNTRSHVSSDFSWYIVMLMTLDSFQRPPKKNFLLNPAHGCFSVWLKEITFEKHEGENWNDVNGIFKKWSKKSLEGQVAFVLKILTNRSLQPGQLERPPALWPSTSTFSNFQWWHWVIWVKTKYNKHTTDDASQWPQCRHRSRTQWPRLGNHNCWNNGYPPEINHAREIPQTKCPLRIWKMIESKWINELNGKCPASGVGFPDAKNLKSLVTLELLNPLSRPDGAARYDLTHVLTWQD